VVNQTDVETFWLRSRRKSGQKRRDASCALGLLAIGEFAMQVSQRECGGANAGRAALAQSAKSNLDRPGGGHHPACSREEPGPPRAPAIAAPPHAGKLLLRHVEKRGVAPRAGCRAPVAQSMPTTPDAIATPGRARAGAVLYDLLFITGGTGDPFHAQLAVPVFSGLRQ